MNRLFDKLNMRPQERRLVMVAGVVLFLVFNAWLVVPHFGDWKVLQGRLNDANRTSRQYEKEISNMASNAMVLERQKEEGLYAMETDQTLTLQQAVSGEAASANISVQSIAPAGGGAVLNNPFFEEQRVTIRGSAGEPELVDFLRRLGELANPLGGTRLIRVRDMDLRPDMGGFRLAFSLTVAERYPKKKKAPGKPGAKNGPPTP
jgi:hypothetical protein